MKRIDLNEDIQIRSEIYYMFKRIVVLLIILALNLSACTTLPPLAAVAPCEYLDRLVQEAATLTEPREESIPSTTNFTLQKAVDCLGEPDYYTTLVWEVWGWSYTIEVFYPQQGIAIRGQTVNFVSDDLNADGSPKGGTSNPQFNTPEEVVPGLVQVNYITITPPVTTFEEFKPLLVEASIYTDREDFLSYALPWEGWNAVVALDIFERFERMESK